jgi:hypothetical protein
VQRVTARPGDVLRTVGAGALQDCRTFTVGTTCGAAGAAVLWLNRAGSTIDAEGDHHQLQRELKALKALADAQVARAALRCPTAKQTAASWRAAGSFAASMASAGTLAAKTNNVPGGSAAPRGAARSFSLRKFLPDDDDKEL